MLLKPEGYKKWTKSTLSQEKLQYLNCEPCFHSKDGFSLQKDNSSEKLEFSFKSCLHTRVFLHGFGFFSGFRAIFLLLTLVVKKFCNQGK